MLAYIFWHRPYPNTERQRYEQAIVRFQKRSCQQQAAWLYRRNVVSDRGGALAERPARL
jgi:hypothetical protein